MQMTDEQAEIAMSAAVNSGNVSATNAHVDSWEGAANDMWGTTGEAGSFTYGGENPTATIYAEDANADGIPGILPIQTGKVLITILGMAIQEL